jgi:hypothetical protein
MMHMCTLPDFVAMHVLPSLTRAAPLLPCWHLLLTQSIMILLVAVAVAVAVVVVVAVAA